jgi:hypothetical protein
MRGAAAATATSEKAGGSADVGAGIYAGHMTNIKSGKRGVSMGGLEISPARRKRQRTRKKREEERWAAKLAR